MSGERVSYSQLPDREWSAEGWNLPELLVGGVEIVPHKIWNQSRVPIFVYDEKGADVNIGTGFFEVRTDTLLMVVSPTNVMERGAQLITSSQDKDRVLTLDEFPYERPIFFRDRAEASIIGEAMDICKAIPPHKCEGKKGFGCMQFPLNGRILNLDESDGLPFRWMIGLNEGVVLLPLLPRRGEPGTGGVLLVKTEHLTGSPAMIDSFMEGRGISSTLPGVTFQQRMSL